MDKEIFDLESLLAFCAANPQPDYILFWGHTAPKDGASGSHFFSQWWLSSFDVEGVSYPSAEHFMMAEKARLFGDQSVLRDILSASTPAEAKKLGRQVAGFDEAIWSKNAFDIVVKGSTEKFRQNKELETYLLSTGDKVLVEASPFDRIWGIGMAASNPLSKDPATWKGRNQLGFALMKARALLARR